MSSKKKEPNKFELQLEQLKVNLKQASTNEERQRISLQIRHLENILKCLQGRKT